MTPYIVRRLLQSIVVLFIVSIIIFSLIRMVPGDPAVSYLGSEATPELIEEFKRELGLDKSIYLQYFIWIKNILRGNMGISYFSHLPVSNLIFEKIPATIQLASYALILSLVIAIPLGIISAIKPYSIMDYIVTNISLIGISIPPFWLGIMLIMWFSIKLNWLPTSGYLSFSENFIMHLKFAIMPSFTLAIVIAAPIMRLLRSNLLEVLSADYIRTARSKGLTEKLVLVRHALRNALIPVITIVGLQFGTLLGGTVVIEAVFNWPGIGWLSLESIYQRDYALLQGTVLMLAFGFLLVNLLVDLLYGFLDPRIRYD